VTLEMHLSSCGRATHRVHGSTAKSEMNVAKEAEISGF